MDATGLSEIVAAVASVAAAAAGAIFWFLFRSCSREAKAANQAAASAKNMAKADINALRAEFAEYKLHVAERYVTEEALTKAVTGLERAIDRLLEAIQSSAAEQRLAIDGIHRRIDQKVDK